MKTKETITKRILQHIEQMWEVKNINSLHPLVHLMIEAVSNELLLLDNKLEGLGISVSGNLVDYFLPPTFNYVRPSHAILQVEPSVPIYLLDKYTSFTFKESPDIIRRALSAVSFTPVVNATIHSTRISHVFHDQTLWTINANGSRKVAGHSAKRAKHNTVWLGLYINSEIKKLKDLAFYLDFRHLPDHHEYYDTMSALKWYIDDKRLEVKSGFPVEQLPKSSKIEREILDFYKDHYQVIITEIEPENIPKRKVPTELINMINEGNFASPLHWISIEFPVNFRSKDLKELFIHLNCIPIVNRQDNQRQVLGREFNGVISLSSKAGQELLEVESIIDSDNRIYTKDSQLDNEYSYVVEPVKRKNIEAPRIIEYLERLADVVQDERSAFPYLDNGKIVQVLNAISTIQDKDTGRIINNRLKEYAEVALLNLKAGENAPSANVSYWTTHGELLNEVPRDTVLMASKIPELNKSDAILLTETNGGRNFYNSDSMKAIANFYLSANNRVLTKYNILSFCRLEFGEYLEKVDVERKAVISHQPQEGMIIIMEIQISPKAKHADYFKQKGVFKDFLIRLRRISPGNFNYRVVVKGEEVSENMRIRS